jgi:hypothetical protein
MTKNYYYLHITYKNISIVSTLLYSINGEFDFDNFQATIIKIAIEQLSKYTKYKDVDIYYINVIPHLVHSEIINNGNNNIQ